MKVSPLKAIRLRCLDCCGDSAMEVRLCPAITCPLYPFRFGKNPNRAGIGPRNPDFSAKNPVSTDENPGQDATPT